jgi:hypothetical protein
MAAYDKFGYEPFAQKRFRNPVENRERVAVPQQGTTGHSESLP